MNAGDREILEHFARTRDKTIELFQRVPEEWLAKRAPGEKMSLGWLFMHIADGPDWWMHHCMRDGQGWEYPGDGSFDRGTIGKALKASRERVLAFFETDEGDNLNRRFELTPDKREGEGSWLGRNRVLYLVDHEVHHRSKIILALRQWGMMEMPFVPF